MELGRPAFLKLKQKITHSTVNTCDVKLMQLLQIKYWLKYSKLV